MRSLKYLYSHQSHPDKWAPPGPSGERPQEFGERSFMDQAGFAVQVQAPRAGCSEAQTGRRGTDSDGAVSTFRRKLERNSS